MSTVPITAEHQEPRESLGYFIPSSSPLSLWEEGVGTQMHGLRGRDSAQEGLWSRLLSFPEHLLCAWSLLSPTSVWDVDQ